MRSITKALTGTLAAAALAFGGTVKADNDTIKFALLQDFTAVYTFLTDEYNQGQRDYLRLINEEGGLDGRTFEALVRDTGNEPQRGLEAYNRARREGAVLVDFLSTPVSRAAVNRVLNDEIVMITALHGRGDASDGTTFPYIFPLMATYWSQATLLAEYIEKEEGGLEGKRIAHVYIDSPFGREPVPVLEELADRKGFELRTFAYPSPGNEQSSTWSDVRRYQPDHVLIWGAGGGQAVSVREAIRNGIDPSNILSVVWLAETDARTVGADRAKGVKRFEAVATGTDYPIMERIREKVLDAGLGTGDEENVGTTYYNIGVATMAMAVEAARLALEEHGGELTGEKLRDGFRMLEDYDAEGMMPPVTFTEDDHQGGGYGRVSEWNGEEWEPITDWYAAYQDIVWEEIEKDAAGFREGR
ncbi:ABC transporter substrate-binding protein [Aquisalimonas asiatica]|uniref:Branched-chain amino acid transport system substrate-binding protein n=1 Tax=Aquisalimonas asiatica TaxID=406100 RepID=A0A1H8QWU0_9GAMM|nr:ABC transporter substrate-binding protein [Aquisalimonas asiatica]SEO58507.1 branched-chain amino acid transport system substrate-binding protein [Aquisalimonas asiatica]